MPRAGGIYTLPAGNPVVTLTVISSAWANTTLSDIATALTGSLPTDGTAVMTGPLSLSDGTVGVPSLTFASQTDLGIYKTGAAGIAVVAGGAQLATISSSGISAVGSGVDLVVSAVNSSALDTHLARLIVTANATSMSILAYNAATSAAPVTGAPTGAQVLLRVAGNVPFEVSTNGIMRLSISGAGVAAIPGGSLILGSTGAVGSLSVARTSDGAVIARLEAIGSGWQIFSNSSATAQIAGSSNGQITIATPTVGVALTVNGFAGSDTVDINAPNTASNSFGLALKAGTNGADYAFFVQNAAASATYFRISGDGTTSIRPGPTNGELIGTNAALTNGAGVSAGTLGTAPTAGNPTKWIKINDNGTIRSVPAW